MQDVKNKDEENQLNTETSKVEENKNNKTVVEELIQNNVNEKLFKQKL